jgi:hypothetical protein
VAAELTNPAVSMSNRVAPGHGATELSTRAGQSANSVLSRSFRRITTRSIASVSRTGHAAPVTVQKNGSPERQKNRTEAA